MRISGGTHRGRRLQSPKGRDIRPTTDRVRQALFNILKKYGQPDGAYVLDLFCGSGVLGLESLSRGANSCIFVDKSRESLNLTQKNAEICDLDDESCHFFQKNALNIDKSIQKGDGFTLIFIDPPYRQGLVSKVLNVLASTGVLAPAALCVIECEKELDSPVPDMYELLEKRHYGDVQLVFCRYRAD